MPRGPLALLASACTALATFAAAAPTANPPVAEFHSRTGNWDVGIDPSLGGGCFIRSSYDDGTTLRVGLDARAGGGGHLLLLGEKWRIFEPGQSYVIDLVFENDTAWEAQAKSVVLSGVAGMLISFRDPALPLSLGAGGSLHISHGGSDLAALSLSGSQAALAALQSCQAQQVGGDQSGT